MKIRTVRSVLKGAFLWSVMSLLLQANSAFACTRDEAFNKMMALNRAQQKMMNAAGSQGPKMLEAAKFAQEVAGVGQTLADQKYAEACSAYDQIAAKYGVDLKQESKGMISMEQIRKDGGKGAGKCSQADASKRMMGYLGQLEDKAANGEIDRAKIREFSGELEKHNDLMYTNPSAFCDKLEELKSKYGL